MGLLYALLYKPNNNNQSGIVTKISYSVLLSKQKDSMVQYAGMEEKEMRKTISIIFVTVMLCIMIPLTGCSDGAADYANPHDVVVAADRGVNVVGKTVKVTATSDVTLGYFYNQSDLSLGANVAVGVYTDDNILGLDMDYSGIHKGQTVIGTIKYYDDALSSSRIILVSVEK